GEVARLRELPWGIGTAFRQGSNVPSRGPAGVFFACRSRTDPPQRYWRYVRDDEIDREDLPMLRRISPGIAASVELTENLEAAWQVAVGDIVREHNFRADPAGIVNLMNLADLRGTVGRLGCSLLRCSGGGWGCFGDLVPGGESVCHFAAVVLGGESV